MRALLESTAALLLAVSAQSSSGQTPEPPALRGAVSAPAPNVFREAVRGRAVDSARSSGMAVAAHRRTPGAAKLTAVPEPSSVAMLASGALGLLGALWRRRRSR